MTCEDFLEMRTNRDPEGCTTSELLAFARHGNGCADCMKKLLGDLENEEKAIPENIVVAVKTINKLRNSAVIARVRADVARDGELSK